MSNLVYQNYNNKCQGWVNPSNLLFGVPEIITLSAYQSPAGSTTLIAVTGNNFYSYSIIRFGTFNPTVYFINSNLLEFYVPYTLSSGTFPIQIFNGSLPSNIVNYTIDNASGYWLLDSDGFILNTNNSGIQISWLSRNAPKNLSNIYDNLNPYAISNNDNWIISNGSGINDVYVILPIGTQYIGREIMFKSLSDSIHSNSSNVKPLNSDIAGTLILSGTGKWVTLVYDGVSWITMQGN